MRQSYKKLKSPHALSAIETICIICLAAIIVAGLVMGFLFYRKTIKIANDRRMVETALRAATLNSIGGCVVKDCEAESGCSHNKDGISVGYFDHITNTVIGERPTGYNEYHIMTIDGRDYRGEEGTMAIEIQYDGETYRLSWVRGKYNAGR